MNVKQKKIARRIDAKQAKRSDILADILRLEAELGELAGELPATDRPRKEQQIRSKIASTEGRCRRMERQANALKADIETLRLALPQENAPEEPVPDLSPTDPRWQEVPPIISGATLGTPTNTGITIDSIAVDQAFSAPDALYVQTFTQANQYADGGVFDTGVDLSYELKESGRVFASTDVSDGSITVDWLSPGTTGVYVALMMYAAGRASAVTVLGPFATIGGTVREFNWNPGVYVGESTDWKIGGVTEHRPTYAQAIDYINNRAWFNADWLPNIGGVRLKFEWGQLESSQGVYHWDVIQAWLDALEPTGGRVLVTSDYMGTNNKRNYAAPSDLTANMKIYGANEKSSGAGFDLMEWPLGGDRTRRICRVWDVSSASRSRYEDFGDALLARFGNNPRFEAYGLKGEGSLGNPGNHDTTFDRLAHDDYLRSLAQSHLARGYRAWLQLPVNGLGGTASALTNGRLWMDFADNNPGVGFRKPDVFSQIRATPTLPKTDWDAVFLGYAQDRLDRSLSERLAHGRWPCAWDWQNPNRSRYNVDAAGILNHWQATVGYDGSTSGEEWDVGNTDLAASLPPVQSGTSYNLVHGATHPVVIFASAANISPADWLSTFQTHGWAPAFSAIPQAWTDAGTVQVVTGTV